MSGPHDIESEKLEIGMRESNLAIADDAMERGEAHLLLARDALVDLPTPSDTVSRVIYAQAHAAVAAATFASVDARSMVEYERHNVSHARAHLDEADRQAAQSSVVQSSVNDALAQVVDKLRADGVDVEQVPGFPGIVIRPPKDDRPNT